RPAQVLYIQNPTDTKKIRLYVHYHRFNKRLDEWVTIDRVDFGKGLEFPKPEAEGTPNRAKSTKKKAKSQQKKGRSNELIQQSLEDDYTDSETATETQGEEDDSSKKRKTPTRSGSMRASANTDNLAKVKNLNKLQIGAFEVETWYFSPYPEDFAFSELVYICEFCLSYYNDAFAYQRHCKKCTLLHPPGNEIYRDDEHSFFEIDGKKQRTYCENLCLLSKLFLDHKTLYYAIDPFLFYILTKRDEKGHHLVGYFSKEKNSPQNYNVACILTLPQYQRMGYGRYLIQFSYELSKIEKKTGSPEKPLSDLGLMGYRAYWYEVLINLLRNMQTATIDALSKETSITPEDIRTTLLEKEVLKTFKGNYVIYLKKEDLDKYSKLAKKKRINIDPSKIIWTPPLL
ncbi:hypothetical protein CONCODRAFT_30550, partial [Conidiobolus coronatus NRRL 28638]